MFLSLSFRLFFEEGVVLFYIAFLKAETCSITEAVSELLGS